MGDLKLWEKLQGLWKHYYQTAHVVVVVVDGTQTDCQSADGASIEHVDIWKELRTAREEYGCQLVLAVDLECTERSGELKSVFGEASSKPIEDHATVKMILDLI